MFNFCHFTSLSVHSLPFPTKSVHSYFPRLSVHQKKKNHTLEYSAPAISYLSLCRHPFIFHPWMFTPSISYLWVVTLFHVSVFIVSPSSILHRWVFIPFISYPWVFAPFHVYPSLCHSLPFYIHDCSFLPFYTSERSPLSFYALSLSHSLPFYIPLVLTHLISYLWVFTSFHFAPFIASAPSISHRLLFTPFIAYLWVFTPFHVSSLSVRPLPWFIP